MESASTVNVEIPVPLMEGVTLKCEAYNYIESLFLPGKQYIAPEVELLCLRRFKRLVEIDDVIETLNTLTDKSLLLCMGTDEQKKYTYNIRGHRSEVLVYQALKKALTDEYQSVEELQARADVQARDTNVFLWWLECLVNNKEVQPNAGKYRLYDTTLLASKYPEREDQLKRLEDAVLMQGYTVINGMKKLSDCCEDNIYDNGILRDAQGNQSLNGAFVHERVDPLLRRMERQFELHLAKLRANFLAYLQNVETYIDNDTANDYAFTLREKIKKEARTAALVSLLGISQVDA